MNWKKIFTPKNTEEIKPGLFIQLKGNKYRPIKPIVWEGEWKLKEQFGWKNLIWIAIILFVAWSYQNDVGEFKDFYEEVKSNPIQYCNQYLNNPTLTNFDLSSVNLTKENDENTNTIFSYAE